MERYCGKLQPAIRSRRFPYASIDRYVTEVAQLTQITAIYDLNDELALRMPKCSVPGAKHWHDPSCMLSNLSI